MNTFYIENIEQIIKLSLEESKHAIKVLRLKNNDKIRLVNGKGLEAYAKIIDDNHKHCLVQVLEQKEETEQNNKVVIAIAPTKNNNRIEWFLEKAIEIGLTDFIPIICENSERKKFNTQRWEKISISALKQSQRLWKTKIHPPIKLVELIKNYTLDIKTIAYCGNIPKENFTKYVNKNKNQIILIGPEGDFSQKEINLAIKNNYFPITLGKNRLRTETAGVVACSLMCLY